MRKGFSYIVFLILVFIVLTIIISLSAILQQAINYEHNDRNLLQAEWYAFSALEFLKTDPALPDINKQKIDIQTLKTAPGIVYPLNFGGFKIVRSKDILYFIGYRGDNLARAEALKILAKDGGLIYPWQE